MEARRFFFNNKQIDQIQTHQIDETLKLTQYRTDFDLKTIIQLAQLKKDIENEDWSQTNEYTISVIIENVLKYIEDSEDDFSGLHGILSKTFIGVDFIKHDYFARVEEFSDDSFLITIEKPFYDFMTTLSSILGIIVLKKTCMDYSDNLELCNSILSIYLKQLRHILRKEFKEAKGCVLLLNELESDYENQAYKDYNDEKIIDKYCEFTNGATVCSLAFIVGHEIGHCFLGHTIKNTVNHINTTRILKKENVNYITRKQEREFQADKKGLVFSKIFLDSYLEKYQYPKIFHNCGVITALMGLAFYSDINVPSESHPPLKLRIEKLISHFPKMYMKKSNEDIINIIYELFSILGNYGFNCEWCVQLEPLWAHMKNLKNYNASQEKFANEILSYVQDSKKGEAYNLLNDIFSGKINKTNLTNKRHKLQDIFNSVYIDKIEIIIGQFIENNFIPQK